MTPFVKWEHARYLTPRQQRKREFFSKVHILVQGMKKGGILLSWCAKPNHPSVLTVMNSLTGTKQQTFIQGPSCLGTHLFLGFFSWIAAFKIDFQKEVDPWCE